MLTRAGGEEEAAEAKPRGEAAGEGGAAASWPRAPDRVEDQNLQHVQGPHRPGCDGPHRDREEGPRQKVFFFLFPFFFMFISTVCSLYVCRSIR